MLESLNQKSASVALPHLAGGTVGVAASGALNAFVPDKQKKIVNIGKLIGSVAVLMASQGGSKNIKPTSFFLGGIAIESSLALAKDLLGNRINTSDTATTGDKVLAGALGLGCPNGSCSTSYPMTYGGLPSLRQPDYKTTFQVVDQPAEDVSVAFT